MAFMGSFDEKKIYEWEKVNSTDPTKLEYRQVYKRKEKILLDDFCLSNYNLNHSKWPDTSKKETREQNFGKLQRLDTSVKTEGLNFTLEWLSGDDLDIHCKCACGNWTKFAKI